MKKFEVLKKYIDILKRLTWYGKPFFSFYGNRYYVDPFLQFFDGFSGTLPGAPYAF